MTVKFNSFYEPFSTVKCLDKKNERQNLHFRFMLSFSASHFDVVWGNVGEKSK